MANYIAIDGGTTNTRISLVADYKIIQTLTFNVGAAKGIDNKNILKETVKKGIADILKSNSLSENDILCILACGMITSEFGLYEVEHIVAPVGINELNQAVEKRILNEISPIPFVFIRGVKTDCKDLENADMMRGEESEIMGILHGEGIYILSGSHSKIIKINNKDRIVEFKTMLTGEMISAISQNTILKDAVLLNEYDINREYLLTGYRYAESHGLNDALFKIRILKNIFKKSEDEIYNFYLGVILCDEIRYVLAQDPPKVIIGGRKAIKEALAVLLKELSCAEVIPLSDDEVNHSSIFGMIKIYEF